jgi:ubiquinol-cytochrome c reductase cytochrome c subunit
MLDRGAVVVGSAVVVSALLAVALSLRAPAGSAQVVAARSPPDVQRIWLRDCATCHGADGNGTAQGPSLRHVGAAATDFQLSTGRMPAPLSSASEFVPSSPESAQERRPPRYSESVIRDLVTYVTELTDDQGTPIPRINPSAGNLGEGENLYQAQCAACHAWSGNGGALLRREAPATHPATALQVAEAVRTGPGNMPAFGRAALTNAQLQSLVRYVRYLDHPDDRGGSPLWHIGPLTEGAIAVFVGLGLLVVAVRLIGTRT